MKRDRFTCVYCGQTGAEAELEIDHVHPVSKGGSHHQSNLVTACRSCNQTKGAGDLKRNPKQPVSTSKNQGFIGLFVYEYKPEFDEGRTFNFAYRIVGVEGDLFLVQMYSAFDGSETTIEVRPRALVLSEQCRLFAHHDVWVERGDRELKACSARERRSGGGTLA